MFFFSIFFLSNVPCDRHFQQLRERIIRKFTLSLLAPAQKQGKTFLSLWWDLWSEVDLNLTRQQAQREVTMQKSYDKTDCSNYFPYTWHWQCGKSPCCAVCVAGTHLRDTTPILSFASFPHALSAQFGIFFLFLTSLRWTTSCRRYKYGTVINGQSTDFPNFWIQNPCNCWP